MDNLEKIGYIFLCSDATENECLERGLLGGKETYANQVKGLKKGDFLYMYNFNKKKLYGPFVAQSEVGEFVPNAWGGGYVSQVYFIKSKSYKPLSRDQLKPHIKFNRNGFPLPKVSAQQIIELEQLFKSKKRYPQFDDRAQIVTIDGHRVISKGEKKIDDWLFSQKIPHAYEYSIPEAKRCDFYIPIDKEKGVYIEYIGLNNHKYLENMEHKREIYRQHSLLLVEILPADLKNLDTFLREKLLPLLIN